MKRPAAFALLVVVAFIAVRHEIYALMPTGGEFYAWFKRDAVMTFPRLAGWLACFWFGRRNGGMKRWGWTWSLAAAGGVVMSLAALMELMGFLHYHDHRSLKPLVILGGWLTSAPVAMYEEAAFRSLLFLSLCGGRSPRAAAAWSSLAFTLFHVEAQPIEQWPAIFVFGFCACAALHRGTGLWPLVAVHWIVDSLWFHFTGGDGYAWAGTAAQLLMLAAAATAFALLAKTDRVTSPASPSA